MCTSYIHDVQVSLVSCKHSLGIRIDHDQGGQPQNVEQLLVADNVL